MLIRARLTNALRVTFGNLRHRVRRATGRGDPHWINEERFRREFLSAYEYSGRAVKTVLQFGAHLPFEIPVPTSSATTFLLEGNEAISILLHRMTTTQMFAAGAMHDHATGVPIARTRAEFIFATDRSVGGFQTSADLTEVFEQCVEHLNYLILGHAIAKHDESIFRVGRETFEFAVIYRVIEIARWHEASMKLFILHDNAPFIKPDTTLEEWSSTVRIANLLKQGWNPFTLSEELRLAARRHLRNGFYRDAVIYAQLSVESFLRCLYIGLRAAEGIDAVEAEEEAESMSFSRLVRSQFSKRIGGQWDRLTLGSFVGRWWEHCYQVRNRAVHAGYMPSCEEARAALHWAYGFRGYVANQVLTARPPYSAIGLYLTTDPDRTPNEDPVFVWGRPPNA